MDGYKDKHTPWRDKETLYELYIVKGLSQPEIGERLGCSGDCVSRWLRKHGVERRKEKYQDKQWLKEKYEDEGLSTVEIADLLDVANSTIWRWMDKHEIKIPRACDLPATFRHHNEPNPAYEYWECGPTGKVLFVHRLLAVSEFGFESVRDMDVHHKNEIPWDNRPCNIEPIDPSDHLKHHWRDSEYDYRKRTENRYTKA